MELKDTSLAMQSSKSGGVSFEWGNLVSKWHFLRHQKADKSAEKSAKRIKQPNWTYFVNMLLWDLLP